VLIEIKLTIAAQGIWFEKWRPTGPYRQASSNDDIIAIWFAKL